MRIKIIKGRDTWNVIEVVCVYAKNVKVHFYCEVIRMLIQPERVTEPSKWITYGCLKDRSRKRMLDLSVSRLRRALESCADEIHISVDVQDEF